MLCNRSLSVRLNGFIIYWPVKIDIFDQNPILTTNEWQNIYECPKKNFPEFPPLEVPFFGCFCKYIYISISMTAVFFFLPILMSVCQLYIKNDKSFSHAVFYKSSVHVSSIFLKNITVFPITGSGRNNALFPPTDENRSNIGHWTKFGGNNTRNFDVKLQMLVKRQQKEVVQQRKRPIQSLEAVILTKKG